MGVSAIRAGRFSAALVGARRGRFNRSQFAQAVALALPPTYDGPDVTPRTIECLEHAPAAPLANPMVVRAACEVLGLRYRDLEALLIDERREP